jgi:hypothetical protein
MKKAKPLYEIGCHGDHCLPLFVPGGVVTTHAVFDLVAAAFYHFRSSLNPRV